MVTAARSNFQENSIVQNLLQSTVWPSLNREISRSGPDLPPQESIRALRRVEGRSGHSEARDGCLVARGDRAIAVWDPFGVGGRVELGNAVLFPVRPKFSTEIQC
mgnify:CR=1 FL=1